MPLSLDWDFAVRFLNITLIDIALSGDNAIVIGMAAASLPARSRKWAIILGGLLAIVLRIGLTAIASMLLLIPLLSAIGGLALVWVVYKLLKPNEAAGVDEKQKQAANLRQAIVLILTADFMMSLDNVIAVAGSAHGNLFLLIAGLLLSMPLLMVAGGAVSALIDKAKWLLYVGAGAISFTAARMIFEDKVVSGSLELHGIVITLISLGVAVLMPLGFVFARRLASSFARKD